jgi:hypothetical protein
MQIKNFVSVLRQMALGSRATQDPLHSISNGGVPITPAVALKNPPLAQSQGDLPAQNILHNERYGA